MRVGHHGKSNLCRGNVRQHGRVHNVNAPPAAQTAQRSNYEREVAATKEQQEKDLANPKKPQLSAERRLIGTDKAKIVIVEYADFQCPACGQGAIKYQGLGTEKLEEEISEL